MTITVHHFLNLCRVFREKYGQHFRDRDTNQLMNIEEAACRFLYGKDWWHTEDFRRDDAMPADQLPDEAATAVIAMTEKLPDWLVPVGRKAQP